MTRVLTNLAAASALAIAAAAPGFAQTAGAEPQTQTQGYGKWEFSGGAGVVFGFSNEVEVTDATGISGVSAGDSEDIDEDTGFYLQGGVERDWDSASNRVPGRVQVGASVIYTDYDIEGFFSSGTSETPGETSPSAASTQDIDLGGSTLVSSLSGDGEVQTFGVMATASWETDSGFTAMDITPRVGVGIGARNVDVEFAGGGSDDDTVAFGVINAGLYYEPNDRVSFGVTGGLILSQKAELTFANSSESLSVDFGGNAGTLGVEGRIRF